MYKKIALSLLFSTVFFKIEAQVIKDTIVLSVGYANQLWYSLSDGTRGVSAKTNWDIAFDCDSVSTSIHINSAIGTALYKYPLSDTTGWLTVDTANIRNWSLQHNSDTSWAIGAFNRGADPGNMNDVGWGIASSSTNSVVGDSLFVIKLSNGAFKKLWIKSFSDGGYNFQFANLDGSDFFSHFLPKSQFAGKNFGYFSIEYNMALDREPTTTENWDLLFTQYIALVPNTFTVAGILTNKGVEVAEVKNVANVSAYTNWATKTFNSNISTIGYDWVSFSGGWVVSDSLVYFIRTNQDEIWKLVLEGFGGAPSGAFYFSKEKMAGTNTKTLSSSISSFSIYPNPSNGNNTTLIYNLKSQVKQANVSVYDLSGKLLFIKKIPQNSGLNTHEIPTSQLSSGMYLLQINCDGQTMHQKLIR